MRQFKRKENSSIEMYLNDLPWLTEELSKHLWMAANLLTEMFQSEVALIGLYGSWQRGDATFASDVDLVVLLNHEVPWFNGITGIEDRSISRKDVTRWQTIERKLNEQYGDGRRYSIVVVTQAMLDYYAAKGPVHLQNWVHAIKNCYPLWESQSKNYL
jgi:predicted nucleotidyltransferase